MRRRRSKLSPEGRRGVAEYSADELHAALVSDAVKRHATDLPWAVDAYTRIGKLRKISADDAYVAVLDEVEALTGMRAMPVHAATSAQDLRDFR